MPILKDVQRAAQIAHVLYKMRAFKYLHFSGLSEHLNYPSRVMLPKNINNIDSLTPVKTREIFEELGGAFLKLAQLLSLRPDIIPKEFCDEFQKLQDHVSPIAFAQVEQVLREELHQECSEIFKRINKQPLGSGSIAQAHDGVLKNNEHVVVKVQRPNVKDIFQADIDLLHYVASHIEKSYPALATLKPSQIVDEFEQYTQREMNFLIEADSMERFYEIFKKSKTVVVPKIHRELTTHRVFVMNYIDGVPLPLFRGSSKIKNLLAKNLADAILIMVFDYGVFHGDLHPGNILITPENELAILDYGIAGKLTLEERKIGLALYLAVMKNDPSTVAKSLLSLSRLGKDADIDGFKRMVSEVMDEHYTSATKVRTSILLYKLVNESFKHGVLPPASYVLVAKAMVTAEGTCHYLNPDFDFVNQAKPFVINLFKKRIGDSLTLNHWVEKSLKLKSLVLDVGEQVQSIASKVEQGKVSFSLKSADVRHLGRDLYTSSNRLSIAGIISSLVLSSALTARIGPFYYEHSILSLIFLAGSVLFGFFLVVSIAREGSRKYDFHEEQTQS